MNIKNAAFLTDNDGKYTVYNLFPDFHERAFEVYYVELHPTCFYEGRPHMGEEFILVKEGTVIVNKSTSDDKSIYLSRGGVQYDFSYRSHWPDRKFRITALIRIKCTGSSICQR